MSGLLELADRVEALTGPCYETDTRIHAALNPDQLWMADPGSAGPVKREAVRKPLSEFPFDEWEDGWRDIAIMMQAPPVTASLDAAITLVPEGWDWSLGQAVGFNATADLWISGIAGGVRLIAATSALALTAAALRARARAPA